MNTEQIFFWKWKRLHRFRRWYLFCDYAQVSILSAYAIYNTFINTICITCYRMNTSQLLLVICIRYMFIAYIVNRSLVYYVFQAFCQQNCISLNHIHKQLLQYGLKTREKSIGTEIYFITNCISVFQQTFYIILNSSNLIDLISLAIRFYSKMLWHGTK